MTYDTPLEKLQAIPAIIREAVERQDKTRFDRSHFKAYGAFSLDFETVFIVLVPDYNSYMDIQQRINLEVFRRFQEEALSSLILRRPYSFTRLPLSGPAPADSLFKHF